MLQLQHLVQALKPVRAVVPAQISHRQGVADIIPLHIWDGCQQRGSSPVALEIGVLHAMLALGTLHQRDKCKLKLLRRNLQVLMDGPIHIHASSAGSLHF